MERFLDDDLSSGLPSTKVLTPPTEQLICLLRSDCRPVLIGQDVTTTLSVEEMYMANDIWGPAATKIFSKKAIAPLLVAKRFDDIVARRVAELLYDVETSGFYIQTILTDKFLTKLGIKFVEAESRIMKFYDWQVVLYDGQRRFEFEAIQYVTSVAVETTIMRIIHVLTNRQEREWLTIKKQNILANIESTRNFLIQKIGNRITKTNFAVVSTCFYK